MDEFFLKKRKDYRLNLIHTAVLFKANSVNTKQWQLSKHHNTNALCYKKKGAGGGALLTFMYNNICRKKSKHKWSHTAVRYLGTNGLSCGNGFIWLKRNKSSCPPLAEALFSPWRQTKHGGVRPVFSLFNIPYRSRLRYQHQRRHSQAVIFSKVELHVLRTFWSIAALLPLTGGCGGGAGGWGVGPVLTVPACL